MPTETPVSRGRARPEARVHAIDFSRPSKFTKEQERRLRRSAETFCRTAASRLSSELRAVLDLDVAGHKQLTWNSAMAELAPSSLSAIVEMRPIDRYMLLNVERPLLLSLVERQLGGEVDPPPADRRMTDIDVALARQLVTRLLDQMTIVWADMAGVQLALAEFDTEPAAAQLATLSEPTWLLAIEGRMGTVVSRMTLALPYRSFAPIAERFPEGAGDGPDPADGDSERRLRAAVGDAEIELRAEVAAVEMTAEQLLALELGDVVRLPAGPGGVTVYAGDVAIHRAQPGRSSRRRAVQVLGGAGGRPHA